MILIIIMIIMFLIYVIITYNSIVNLKKKVEQSKSTIDVYLKQRFDLIPNLVSCVKQYSDYESGVLETLISMRTSYFESPKTLSDGSKLNDEFNKIILSAEKYPSLKANEQFLALEQNLIKLESQLQAARRLYNTDVTAFNTKVSIFPSNIIASIFGFKVAELFAITSIEAKNININEKEKLEE